MFQFLIIFQTFLVQFLILRSSFPHYTLIAVVISDHSVTVRFSKIFFFDVIFIAIDQPIVGVEFVLLKGGSVLLNEGLFELLGLVENQGVEVLGYFLHILYEYLYVFCRCKYDLK